MTSHSLIRIFIWASLLLQASDAGCFRIPKENTRVKSRCFANITSSPREERSVIRRPRCAILNHPYCLDLKLPYNETLVPDHITDINLRSSQEVVDYLEQWRGVQKVPRCWPILRVLLCSLLMPQCEEAEAMIQHHQSSVDICHDLVKNDHCKFVERHLEGWPSIFNCSDSRYYAKNCSNDLRELKYAKSINHRPTCQYPLVPSDEERNFFSDISGCALHCKYPITNPDEQANIKLTVSVLCSLGLICTITALILYTVNRTNRRPSRMAKVVKHCIFCQLLFYIGWSLQLFSDHDLGCRSDGSMLYSQPLVANLCVLSFLLTYLPSLSSLFWCAHLGKLFHENRQAGKVDNGQEKSTDLDRTLSLFIYGIPLTLFVSVVFFGQIDGQGHYGICTVGQESITMKIAFVFVPTLFGTIYGNYYFLRICVDLALTEKDKMNPTLKRSFVRISILSILTILQIVFEIANFYYEHSNREQWLSSIESYVACQLDLPYAAQRADGNYQNVCRIASRPVVTPYYLEVLSTLGIGIVISSWTYSEPNYRGLVRKFIDLIEDEKERQNRVSMYLRQDHDTEALNNCNNSRQITYLDLDDMHVTNGHSVEHSLGHATEQFCPRPPEVAKPPAPDPMVVMQMLLMNSETIMKMQSKAANHGSINENPTPNFTHALSSYLNNPAPCPDEHPGNFRSQRRSSSCLSERLSLGSVSLCMSSVSKCHIEESNSSHDSSVSTTRRRKRRLHRKRHYLLKNSRSRTVVRDCRKQRLNQQKHLKNNDLN